MGESLRYVSVCAGIEAASVAWHPLGWEAALLSEIEPFPRAVLQHHYPDVPLHGDFTTLIADPPPADLLVGGTPCQAFSVAGKRLSLEDYRGNLSLAFADLALAGRYRWVVWENVPGVLSTKDNAFGCFLGRLAGDESAVEPPGGKWDDAGLVVGPTYTCAWRVLDAQYFGLAQRRKRVFVLARLGAGHGAAPAALFPVGQGVSGYPAPRREAGQSPTDDAPASVGGGGERTGTLNATSMSMMDNRTVEAGITNPASTVVGALDTECGFTKATDQTVRNGHILPVATVMRQREGKEGGGKGPLCAANVSLTLAASNDQTVFAIQNPNLEKAQNGTGISGNVMYTLEAGRQHGVFAAEVAPTVGASGPPYERTGNSRVEAEALVVSLTTEQTPKFADNLAQTVTQGSPSGGGHPQCVASATLRPRRLTPSECEKLQGFPVGWTNVPWKKGMSPDGPRYRALGNSMAVPVIRWLGERIAMVDAMEEFR